MAACVKKTNHSNTLQSCFFNLALNEYSFGFNNCENDSIPALYSNALFSIQLFKSPFMCRTIHH